jgi:hypothetical protein
VKEYPSIPGWRKSPEIGSSCIAFEKYDGSNLRWEWQLKRGWYKYGTRTRLFDASHVLYGQAIPLFQDVIGPIVLDRILSSLDHKASTIRKMIAFTEFFGPSSFAGQHDEAEPKQLKLFDVWLFQKGLVEPKLFLSLFYPFDFCAREVYSGPMNNQFILDVQRGDYSVTEGVICKGHNWSAKIKTSTYLERLKKHFGHDWEKYAE